MIRAMKKFPVWPFALLLFAGCRETTNVEIQSIDFQTHTTLDVNETLSSDDIAQLAPSQCLWKSYKDNALLSWDSVAQFQLEGANINQISACTNTGPGGTPLRVDGHDFQDFGWGAGATLQACRDSGSPNPNNECRVLTASCNEVQRPCDQDPHNSNFPFCQSRCSMRPYSDATYKIESEVIPTTGQRGVGVFSPTFYDVEHSRTLVRRLSFDSQRSEPANHKYVWTWNIRTLPDGRWEENFSPHLMITKVRAFTPNPSYPDGRQYLQLAKLYNSLVGFQNCEPSPYDWTEFIPDSCVQLLRPATPGYFLDARREMILWGVQILGSPERTANTGLSESSEVFIEFTVTNRFHNDGTLTFSGYRANLGTFQGVGGSMNPGFLKIYNDETVDTWTVESLSVEGPNASDFSAWIEGNRPTPFDIRPGGSFSVQLNFTAKWPVGVKHAYLKIPMHNQAGFRFDAGTGDIAATVAAPAVVTVQPATVVVTTISNVQVTPSSLSFTTPDTRLERIPPSTESLVKSVEIKNIGQTPLTRSDIIIEGTDSTSFQIFAPSSSSPPPASHSIAPGQSETVTVRFSPAAGRLGETLFARKKLYTAELRVSTSGGEGIVQLRGSTPSR